MIVYGGDYEHTLEVSSSPHGVDLDYRVTSRPDLFAKVLKRQEFDACEFSLSNYIMLRDRGADWLTAVPVFPNRAFRHGTIAVRRDSTICSFRDLVGRRVGISDYTMTGGVWCRGIMLDQYGVHWSEMEWFSGETPRFPAPAAARVSPSALDLEAALSDGAIDALFLPRNKDALLPVDQRRFRPLLADWRAAELDYFKTTQIYPISHVIVIPRASVAKARRLPDAIYAAYSHSMQRAKARRLATSLLPWGAASWDDAMQVFAGDPLPYGLTTANLKIIRKLQDYLVEQQLVERQHDIADLFERVDADADVAA
ncbi:PhnD/SsuA/transferrin family substrate-binding protein [Tardiphaga sp.]|uniref:PhnD/SsuA/transferrin family substrate-binding protein n=1 Tax=Tardiphaga sp. TaxID=1926292 RepID=UPI00261522BF|nr:PhnD/SsuA/transferrin family substrate-binding protein [Tardiphaga sp.]MDB5619293.1 dihydroxyphthalate decarboxylase [Tardiphaga sp.]